MRNNLWRIKSEEVEGVHDYSAHKLRSMADEEHIYAELLKDVLNQLA